MKRLFAIALLLTLLFSGCAAPTEAPASAATLLLSVHYIDVDQADCMLLTVDDTAVLIDGGNTGTAWKVVSYLKQHGIEELDLVVNTHPHGDHLGGIPAVLQNIPVEELWCSHDSFDTSLFTKFKAAAAAQNLPISLPEPGDVFEEDGLKITVLGPLFDNDTYQDLNDTSLVLMVQYGQRKFLFTGDMEAYAEKQLVAADVDLDADVLKVGHHGSYSSTSQIFLNEVTPEYGVITCGRNNEYGHPHDAPMGRLNRANVELFRTDLMGSIVIITNGDSLSFFTEFNLTSQKAA